MGAAQAGDDGRGDGASSDESDLDFLRRITRASEEIVSDRNDGGDIRVACHWEWGCLILPEPK